VVAGVSAKWLGTEFLPELDEGDAYVLVQMPASISLEKGQEVLRDVRLRLKVFPEVITVTTEQGRPESGTDNETLNLAKVLVRLKPHGEWRKGLTKPALIEEMRATLGEIPGVAFNFAQPIRDSVEESTSGARGQVVLKLFGPDIPTLRGILQQTKSLVKGIDGVVDLDLYRDAPAPQVHVQFDRQALARQGIAMEDAQKTLEVALAGNVATTLWEGEFPVPVRVRLPYVDRMDEERIRNIAIPLPDGGSVPLGSVGTVSMKIGNSSIFREGNARYMALKFNVEGRDIGSVVKDTLATFKQNVKLPEGYQAVWGGEWENQQRVGEPAACGCTPEGGGAAVSGHRLCPAVWRAGPGPQRRHHPAVRAVRHGGRHRSFASGTHRAVHQRGHRLYRLAGSGGLGGLAGGLCGRGFAPPGHALDAGADRRCSRAHALHHFGGFAGAAGPAAHGSVYRRG